MTGPVAGIAAGGAAVVALAAGVLSSDDSGSGSSRGSSSSTNTDASSSNSGSVLTGTLIDSTVSGISYQSTSNLSGNYLSLRSLRITQWRTSHLSNWRYHFRNRYRWSSHHAGGTGWGYQHHKSASDQHCPTASVS